MKKIFVLFFCAVLLVLAPTSIFAQSTSESMQTVFVSDILLSSVENKENISMLVVVTKETDGNYAFTEVMQ